MARNITLTLGAGLGADLGPNFNLTANVGSVTPSTATKSELTAGKSVSVDDAATEVTITSTGTCTNAITQTIPCGGTTSTTTEPPTTTTTTQASICYERVYRNDSPSIQNVSWTDCCTSVYYNEAVDPNQSVTTYSILEPNFGPGVTLISGPTVHDCGTTTTTTAAPTTTTTTSGGVTYDHYYADQYDCATCTFQQSNYIVAFLSGTSVINNKWYAAGTPDGNAYYITGTAPSGPGLIMFASDFNNCGMACMV